MRSWRTLALLGCGLTAASVLAIVKLLSDGAAQQVTIERLNLALARSNRDLDQFAYVASHDLKAPLRNIATLATWIDEELGDVPPGQSRAHLGRLRARVDRLEALIQGILTYARANQVVADHLPVDVGMLVRDSIELLAPPVHVTIAIESELPALITDRTRLQQCFVNLIGNAIKHGRTDAAAIQIGGEPLEDGWRFWVRDNGPGIPSEYHDRVFELFQTLAPRDEVEGAGIGLAVVKRLVEARGGEVAVSSRPGAGARFEFTWPRAQAL